MKLTKKQLLEILELVYEGKLVSGYAKDGKTPVIKYTVSSDLLPKSVETRDKKKVGITGG